MEDLDRATGLTTPLDRFRGTAITTKDAEAWREQLALMEGDCRLLLTAIFEFDARLTEAIRRRDWNHYGKLGPKIFKDSYAKPGPVRRGE